MMRAQIRRLMRLGLSEAQARNLAPLVYGGTNA